MAAEGAPTPPVTVTALHQLPMHTKWRGTADTSIFTQTITKADGDDVSAVQGRFRGRKLIGRVVRVPAGFTGALIPCEGKGDATRVAAAGRKRDRDDETPARSTEAAAGPATAAKGIAATGAAAATGATFDAFTVWEHERQPARAQVDGPRLLVKLATLVHGAAPPTANAAAAEAPKAAAAPDA